MKRQLGKRCGENLLPPTAEIARVDQRADDADDQHHLHLRPEPEQRAAEVRPIWSAPNGWAHDGGELSASMLASEYP